MTISMLSNLYRRYSVPLLWAIAISFPYFAYYAETIRSNNDLETWLPKDTPARLAYEDFKREFGVEELIVIGLKPNASEARLVEALAGRLDTAYGIQKCWTPERLKGFMTQMGVEEETAQARLNGLIQKEGGELTGIIGVLSEEGIKDRSGTVAAVKKELAYCQIQEQDFCLTGTPVVVTELDRLGSRNANRKFFILTLVLSLGLLHYSIGHWGMAFAILGLTLWGINVTVALINLCGGETNFILGALPVMVMIFTLSVCLHFLSYYQTARDERCTDPLGTALKQSWKPCFLSTLTTLIGLFSLNVSEIIPVIQFGYAAGLGSVVAMIVGQGLTPTLMVIWPECGLRGARHEKTFHHIAAGVVKRTKGVLVLTTVLLVVAFIGLTQLSSDINPVEFLPAQGRVRQDLMQVDKGLTSIDSIEAVVSIQERSLPFMEKLNKVREIEKLIGSHPKVRHTMSLATFFPEEMPEGTFSMMRILRQAQNSRSGRNEFLSNGDQLWRISARIDAPNGDAKRMILAELEELTQGKDVTYTGVTPLLEYAQRKIFSGFWESMTGAFFVITLVMILSLRSLKAGLIAMIPNIVPIWFVFGAVGFLGMTVDISMMMTGSIALGISVDCTFHFMVWYRQNRKAGKTAAQSAEIALQHCGEPMLDSTIVGSVGMLALGLSNFAPTARFGYVMSALMIASLYGEVILLPALLCIGQKRKNKQAPPDETIESNSYGVHGPSLQVTGKVA